MLASLFDFVRDLAILAAALGIARWAWDWHSTSANRRDEAAKSAIADERWRADMRQWVATVESRLGEALGDRREAAARTGVKVRVHKLLQSTSDPYLSFGEIERALAPSPITEAAAVATAGPASTPDAVSGDALRSVLIELVGDGVIAQMDHDRYFIASDYETGDDEDNGQG